jgi:hypothetical protein
MDVNGDDSIAYDYCHVAVIGENLQETLEQEATFWRSSLHIIRGTFIPNAPGTTQLVELSPNGGVAGSSGGGSSGSGGVPGLNPGCQQSGEACTSGSCCSGLTCFDGACEPI